MRALPKKKKNIVWFPSQRYGAQTFILSLLKKTFFELWVFFCPPPPRNSLLPCLLIVLPLLFMIFFLSLPGCQHFPLSLIPDEHLFFFFYNLPSYVQASGSATCPITSYCKSFCSTTTDVTKNKKKKKTRVTVDSAAFLFSGALKRASSANRVSLSCHGDGSVAIMWSKFS